ncbi:MAG: DUF4276 family protein [Thermodesulfobacteriota bacterium]
MHLELLVEEPSAEAALQNLVPKIIGEDVSYNIHVFQGKQDLLKNLPKRLRGYRPWLPDDWYIVILIDNDQEGCVELKQRLEKIAFHEGFITRSNAGPNAKFNVINRIAIEELEAWFLGDMDALRVAYPKIPRHLGTKAKFRNPDAIHNSSETLERELRRAGYYRGGMPKIEVARRISQHMDPVRNISKSFQVFRVALQEQIP